MNATDIPVAEPNDPSTLLIIFIAIVFVVLTVFILLYYYCVRNMKSSSDLNRQTHKSTSGSIMDEKSRNIFAHPERQLAVDQSFRTSPSASSSESEANPGTPATTGANTANQQHQQPQSQQAQQQPQQSDKQHQTTALHNQKSKSKSGSRGKDLTMVGTLAEIRDTLKGTRTD